jgi:hypothetical protein
VSGTDLHNSGGLHGMANYRRLILATLIVLQYPNFGGTAFADPFRYSADGCDFAVSFPLQPIISNVSAGGLEVHEAELKSNLSIMRAICLVAPNQFANDLELLKGTIQDYFDKNGMVNASVTIENAGYGKRAEGRAYKKINGAWATYVTIWYVTPTSAMTLTAATLSEQYPTEQISAFIGSVETP